MKFFPEILARLLAIAMLTFGVIAGVAAGDTGQIKPKAGWHWRVFQSGLELVDNLAVTDAGVVYATLERGAAGGRLVRISHGKVEVLLDGLDRADGLVADGDMLFVTEEVGTGRVLAFNRVSRVVQVLARLHKPEGIAILSGGDLLLAEDIENGRLLRLGKDGTLVVLAHGLNRPEGIRVASNGTIYIAETRTGRILRFRDGRVSVLLEGLHNPDQLALAADGSLWIAEDANPGRVLRYRHGSLEVMATGIAAPQGMAFDGRGRLLVSEQYRHRILLLYKRNQ